MESTLAISKADLDSEIGEFMGWGRDPTKWTARKLDEINRIRDSGLRCFYEAETDGQGPPHEWSFLRPTKDDLALAEGESTTELPDDFGNVEGKVAILVSGGSSPWPALPVTGEGNVRERYAINADMTGMPQVLSVRPIKGTTATRGQRFEFYVWPLADQDYTLAFTYTLLTGALTADRPYPYGGASHAETILESCLAVAEVRKDNRIGEHTARFQRRLNASIAKDRRNKPAHFGYNGDRSDGVVYHKGLRETVTATIAGMEPDYGIQ